MQPIKFTEIRLWNKLVDLFSVRATAQWQSFQRIYFFTFQPEHDMLDHDLPPMVCWDTHESPHMPPHYAIRTRFEAYKLKHITRTYSCIRVFMLIWFRFLIARFRFLISCAPQSAYKFCQAVKEYLKLQSASILVVTVSKCFSICEYDKLKDSTPAYVVGCDCMSSDWRVRKLPVCIFHSRRA